MINSHYNTNPQQQQQQAYQKTFQYNPRQYQPYVFKPNFLKNQPEEGPDGQMTKPRVFGRKFIDWTSPCLRYVQRRKYMQFPGSSRPSYVNCGTNGGTHVPPDELYSMQVLPPFANLNCPANCVTSRFVRTATNKRKCQIYKIVWTPDGRRLITGASTGEFTLWNGMAFNFETILQAHDQTVRSMTWTNNEQWLVSGDHAGFVKYWQVNMNNVHMFQAHKDMAVRSISFSPSDHKFATCSDDATVRIWDFLDTKSEERTMRGHGADVKEVQWHPQKALIASGSKDLQTPVKLWDPKTGGSVATLHCHKGTVMDLKWNKNGKWLLTASRDHTIKLFDVRNLKSEMQVFRGHKCEASCIAFHPIHEGLFVSGGSDGGMFFWQVGEDTELAAIEPAHTSIIWTLSWHPLGHALASGSNDNTVRFWTRNRPGDTIDSTGCNRDFAEHEMAPDVSGDQRGGYQNYQSNREQVPTVPTSVGNEQDITSEEIPGINKEVIGGSSDQAAFSNNGTNGNMGQKMLFNRKRSFGSMF